MVSEEPGQRLEPSARTPESDGVLEPSGALDATEPSRTAELAGAIGSSSAEELAAVIARSAAEVSGYLDALAHRIAALNGGRADRSDLARQIEAFARQYHDRFPDMSAIAERLAKLLRHQARLVERLQWASERLIAGSGRLTDKLSPPGQRALGEGAGSRERPLRR